MKKTYKLFSVIFKMNFSKKKFVKSPNDLRNGHENNHWLGYDFIPELTIMTVRKAFTLI